MIPEKQIRAVFNDETVRVYQAYRPAIALPAIAAQRFVPPFKLDRMTWIKPSFLWMMYRCGWGQKPGQEHVLAIDIRRDGLAWALEHGCLSSAAKAGVDSSDWSAYKRRHPVRIQWDPERDLNLNRLDYRSIQIGLSGDASRRYVQEWVVAIEDVTPLAQTLHQAVGRADLDEARRLLPKERIYPVTGDWRRLGLAPTEP